MPVVHELNIHFQPPAQFEKPIPRPRAYGDFETRGLLGHGGGVVSNGHQGRVCFEVDLRRSPRFVASCQPACRLRESTRHLQQIRPEIASGP